MVRTCIINGCNSKSSNTINPNLSFHKLQGSNILIYEKRLDQIEKLNNQIITNHPKHATICSRHYSEECFVPNLLFNKLEDNAIPTIFPSSIEWEKNASKYANTCLPVSEIDDSMKEIVKSQPVVKKTNYDYSSIPGAQPIKCSGAKKYPPFVILNNRTKEHKNISSACSLNIDQHLSNITKKDVLSKPEGKTIEQVLEENKILNYECSHRKTDIYSILKQKRVFHVGDIPENMQNSSHHTLLKYLQILRRNNEIKTKKIKLLNCKILGLNKTNQILRERIQNKNKTIKELKRTSTAITKKTKKMTNLFTTLF